MKDQFDREKAAIGILITLQPPTKRIPHYLLRWVNTRGQKGPWSETASAMIGT